MAGYSTPAWTNGAAPGISAAALTAISQALEISEHPQGYCTTSSGTAAKTVNLDFSFTPTLFVGMSIMVGFQYGNTVDNPTLNVNGTGAYPIHFNGRSAKSGDWDADTILHLLFNGIAWHIVSGPKGTKVTQTTILLPAANWLGDGAPFSQTVTVNGMTSGTICFFDVAQSADVFARYDFRKAAMYLIGQGTNSVTFSVDEIKPNLDIPVTLTIFST